MAHHKSDPTDMQIKLKAEKKKIKKEAKLEMQEKWEVLRSNGRREILRAKGKGHFGDEDGDIAVQ